MSDPTVKLLNDYNNARAQGKAADFEQAWHFCNNQEDADELAELTIRGIKRGTASLYYWYQCEGERLPLVGDYNIITDYEGTPKCVIRVFKVDIVPFKDVSEKFAFIEGEGDKSLAYWKKVHVKFFTEDLKEKNIQFNETMKVVCETFEVVRVC